MKFKLIFSALLLTLFFASCKMGYDKMYVLNSTDSLSTVDSTYFKVSLKPVENDKDYFAESSNFRIVDDNKNLIKFNNSDEFIAFISDNGYFLKELKNQNEYVFHKKYRMIIRE